MGRESVMGVRQIGKRECHGGMSANDGRTSSGGDLVEGDLV
jgi:hypothetical protein